MTCYLQHKTTKFIVKYNKLFTLFHISFHDIFSFKTQRSASSLKSSQKNHASLNALALYRIKSKPQGISYCKVRFNLCPAEQNNYLQVGTFFGHLLIFFQS